MSRPLVLPAREARTSTFQRWWNTQGEWVEEPNQRRAGESGVQRIRLRDPQQPLLYCILLCSLPLLLLTLQQPMETH